MGVDARMLVVTSPKTDDEVRLLAYDLCEAFGADKFWISKDATFGTPHHAISRIKEYQQDGPDLAPQKGEDFLEVHLMTRYYGEGYERGDFPLLYSIAIWLEKRTKGKVLYGGDSSGVCATEFDVSAREKLLQHFVAVGHKPYRAGWGQEVIKKCDFCGVDMVQSGWGQGGKYVALYCPGCNTDMISNDGGKTWADRK